MTYRGTFQTPNVARVIEVMLGKRVTENTDRLSLISIEEFGRKSIVQYAMQDKLKIYKYAMRMMSCEKLFNGSKCYLLLTSFLHQT